MNEDKKLRNEIKGTIQLIKERDQAILKKSIDKCHEDKAYVRSVMKLIELDNKALAENETLLKQSDAKREIAELEETLVCLEKEFHNQRKKLATIQDKKDRTERTETVKATYNKKILSIKQRRDYLLDLFNVEQATQNKHADMCTDTSNHSTESYKTISDKIKALKKKQQSAIDKMAIHFQIAILYEKINENTKSIENYKHATQRFIKGRKFYSLTADCKRKVLEGEHRRMRGSHKKLFLYYLSNSQLKPTIEHMKKWLELSSIDERESSLEYLEEKLNIISTNYGLQELQTEESMLDDILINESLGCMSDFRLGILEELYLLSPKDEYILCTIGEMYIKLKQYDKARKILEEYVKLPSVSNLPLWADIVDNRKYIKQTKRFAD